MYKSEGLANTAWRILLITALTSLVAANAASYEPRTLWVVPFAHCDLFWLGAPADTLSRGDRIIEEAMELAEADPEFRFHLEDMVFVAHFTTTHPNEVGRLRKLIAKGQLECSAKWTGIFQMSQHGEDLVRNILYGHEYAVDTLGVKPEVAHFGDHPGYTPQMPQLLKQAGVKGAVFTRAGPRHVAYFDWQSPDGSTVSAYSFGTYGSATWLGINEDLATLTQRLTDPESFRGGRRYPQVGQATEKAANLQEYLLAYPEDLMMTWGFDLILPPQNLVNVARQWNQQSETLQIRVATLEEYFDHKARETTDPPVLMGDAPSMFQGILPFDVWKEGVSTDRELSHRLLMAEKWASLASVEFGFDYPAHELDEAWMRFLETMDHNGPVNNRPDSIRYREDARNYAISVADHTSERSLAVLAANVQSPDEEVKSITVFNSNSWPRTDWVKTLVVLYGAPNPFEADAWAKLHLTDDQGKDVPFEILSSQRPLTNEAEIAFLAQDVPPIGYRTYYLYPIAENDTEGDAIAETTPWKASDEPFLENDYYRIEINNERNGLDVLDKQVGKELIHGLGVTSYDNVVLSGRGEGFNIDHQNKTPVTFTRWERQDGPSIQMLTLHGEVKGNAITYEVQLPSYAKRFDTHVRAEWRQDHFNLMQIAPLTHKGGWGDIEYATPYGFANWAERMPNVGLGERAPDALQRAWEETRDNAGWVQFRGKKAALTVASGRQCFRLTGTAPSAASPRAETGPSPSPSANIVEWMMLSTSNEELVSGYGAYGFKFRFSSGTPEMQTPATAERLASELFAPLRTVVNQNAGSGIGLPPVFSFCEIDSDAFVLTTLKRTDAGHVVLRGYDAGGNGGKVRIRPHGTLETAKVFDSNILEQNLGDGKRNFRLRPQEIKTILLEKRPK